jgi:hypothetical protein
VLRYLGVAGGLVALVLALGYFLQLPLATSTWPWPDSPLSYIFLASIFAAIGVIVVWLSAYGEWAAMVGGALNLGIASGGSALFLLQLAAAPDGRSLLPWAVGLAIFSAYCFGLFVWSRRLRIRDRRPMPRPVRVSFWVFTAALVAAGVALLARVPNVFPWPLDPRSSAIFGWIFLGAAAYFAFAALRPRWHDARGQLLGFLAYDLVLIGPFLAHFGEVRPEHVTSLVIYVAVLLYSGALAVFYLWVHPQTRSWAIDEASP